MASPHQNPVLVRRCGDFGAENVDEDESAPLEFLGRVAGNGAIAHQNDVVVQVHDVFLWVQQAVEFARQFGAEHRHDRACEDAQANPQQGDDEPARLGRIELDTKSPNPTVESAVMAK